MRREDDCEIFEVAMLGDLEGGDGLLHAHPPGDDDGGLGLYCVSKVAQVPMFLYPHRCHWPLLFRILYTNDLSELRRETELSTI